MRSGALELLVDAFIGRPKYPSTAKDIRHKQASQSTIPRRVTGKGPNEQVSQAESGPRARRKEGRTRTQKRGRRLGPHRVASSQKWLGDGRSKSLYWYGCTTQSEPSEKANTVQGLKSTDYTFRSV